MSAANGSSGIGVRNGPVDAAALRGLMSHWPTGVSIVGTLDGDGPTGCTLNALTSLSLDPLEILICLHRSSSTLSASLQYGRFSLSFLADDQRELSARFAGRVAPTERFEGIGYAIVEGAPVIDGCVAFLVCDVIRQLDGGDHEIVIGRPLVGSVDPGREPLVFLRSDYHRMPERV